MISFGLVVLSMLLFVAGELARDDVATVPLWLLGVTVGIAAVARFLRRSGAED